MLISFYSFVFVILLLVFTELFLFNIHTAGKRQNKKRLPLTQGKRSNEKEKKTKNKQTEVTS